MKPVNISILSRKFSILILFLSLAACDTPKPNVDSTPLVRAQSGSVDKIYSLLNDLGNRLPSDEAGIAVGYVEGNNTTIAFVGNQSFTEETLFEYGSITKVLTANILMQLVNEGSLRLDDSLNKFLPEDIQDQRWEPITLFRLATHTAGIPNSPPSLSSVQLAERGIDPFADYDQTMLYQDIQETKAISIDKWNQSNYGYALLGLTLSQRTNIDYADLVQQRIFDPLGMEGATIDGWSSDNIAPPLNSSGGDSSYWNFKAFASTGALRGNILDGISFLKASMSACQSNDIVARSNCQTQQPTNIQIRYKNTQMGLGWYLTLKDDDIVIWKNGLTGGYSAFIAFNPDKQVGVVLLSNVALFRHFYYYADNSIVSFLFSD